VTSTLKQEAVLNYSPTKLKACRSSIKNNNAGLLIHQKMITLFEKVFPFHTKICMTFEKEIIAIYQHTSGG
jgi:hypothetical protein